MFRNTFNYSKLLSWTFFININHKYELFNEKIIYECFIKNILETGCIPIKFIQWIMPYLHYTVNEENKWILEKFSKCYEDCNIHSLEFTKNKYYNYFNTDLSDDYTDIVEIASGSIGQLYRVKSISDNKYHALKIIHPGVEYEINFLEKVIKIIEYCFDIKSYCPINLLECLCDFKKQINFINEANNLLYFHEKYNNNPHIIIPKIIKVSKEILIMEYIDGKTIEETTISEYNKHKILLLLTLFTENNLHILGYSHGDLHIGNWKIIDDNHIVIYDFGYCWELEKKDLQPIINLILYFSQKEKYSEKEKYEIIYKCFDYFELHYNKKNLNEYLNKNKINTLDEFFICLINYSIRYKVSIHKNVMNIFLTYSQIARFMNNSYTMNQINICKSYNIFNELLNIHLYPVISRFQNDHVKTEYNEFKDLKKYII
tara:strand:- start:1595 stop:2884 length:1290 start_codon:yes stop_codon:yes gene_type:complete